MRLWKRRMQYYGQAQPAYIVIMPKSVVECQLRSGSVAVATSGLDLRPPIAVITTETR